MSSMQCSYRHGVLSGISQPSYQSAVSHSDALPTPEAIPCCQREVAGLRERERRINSMALRGFSEKCMEMYGGMATRLAKKKRE